MLASTQDSMQKLYVLSQNNWSNRSIPILSVLQPLVIKILKKLFQGCSVIVCALDIVKLKQFLSNSKINAHCSPLQVPSYGPLSLIRLHNSALRERYFHGCVVCTSFFRTKEISFAKANQIHKMYSLCQRVLETKYLTYMSVLGSYQLLLKNTFEIRMVTMDQLFCDKIFAKITLGIKIVLTEGVNCK